MARGTMVLSLLLAGINLQAQVQHKVAAIGFYNCENFFDTVHDGNKKDEDFTPEGAYHYTGAVYRQKVHNIATVISRMGTGVTPDGPAIVGLVEIENDRVLNDLVAQPELASRHYKYAWFYTSDERGISTAMLYNPKYFTLLQSRPVRVPTETLKMKRPTRDILYVCGVLAGDTIHVLVNHWPSKSGGEATSAPGRELVASIDKRITDSLMAVNPEAKVLIMGDLNDNPDSKGVKEILGAEANITDVTLASIYNPWMKMYKKGMGTESYRGEWNLIDQIMMSGNFVKNKNDKWKYYDAEIFKKDFLMHSIGREQGMPHRSFTISRAWDNGYSDHFPVLVYLVEKK